MADGEPISEAVATAAAEWLTLLMSGEATEEDRRSWQRWRAASLEHERAWQHIEAVTGRLKLMEPKAAYTSLSPYSDLKSPGRRKALNILIWGGAIGVTSVLASRTQIWQQTAADYRTGIGQQRTVTLADDTRIVLDTASAIDVEFDSRQRLVRLVAGQIMIATGHRAIGGRADPRPFIVQTDQGRIRALGTRFVVRQEDGHTAVDVQESAVEITPSDATWPPRLLKAGERTAFTLRGVDQSLASIEQDAAWTRGQIVADNVRLGDFLTDLARYRPGIVRCDPGVAGLRFSGVFPLNDTDRILAILPNVLPVQVRLRTRYWVTVEAAQ